MTDGRTAGWAEIGRARYVSLGTRRRTGVVVATPVWIAALGDALVVTTEAGTGKVKRLRNDPAVVLRPCSVRGVVAPAAATVEARAEIVGPEGDQRAALAALRRKYGIQFVLFTLVERVVRIVRRRHPEHVILRITR